jgi:RNA polymerase sigma factor (sigma-70 family)
MNEARPPETAGGGAFAEAPWAEMVRRIRAGDPSGMEELYRVFSSGVRFHLLRQFGSQDLDDKLHDVFLIIARSIRDGELREPERLMGYVHTVVQRQMAEYIKVAVHERHTLAGLDQGMSISGHEPDPERRAIERQNMELAQRVLNAVPKRDREVLIRFYLREQSVGEICQEMDLTETQFRLIKSRAKIRFGELGRTRLGLRRLFRH